MGKPLSNRQREKIGQLISDHYLAFAVDVIGPDAVSSDNYARLQRQGLLKTHPVEHTAVSLAAAYTLGKIAASDTSIARMQPAQFWQYVETAPPQFNQHDLDAIQASRAVVGRLIVNLGVGLLNEFESVTHEEATKLRHEALATVQHEIALGAAGRSSRTSIEKRLRSKLAESERNWALVVQTELHNALEGGKALGFARSGNPLVYKRPRQDACRFCKLLFLNGSKPRLFRLSELVKNGTNAGRRAGRPSARGTQWKATIGCVHPGCQCEMHLMPEGMAFDDSGKLIVSMRKAMADTMTADLRMLIGHQCVA